MSVYFMRHIFILLVCLLSLFSMLYYKPIFSPKHYTVKLNRELLGDKRQFTSGSRCSTAYLVPSEHSVFVARLD